MSPQVESLVQLLFVYASVVVLNVGAYLVLWKSTRSEYYKILMFAWGGGAILLISQGLIDGLGVGALGNALVYTFTFIIDWYLSFLLARIVGIRFPKKFFLMVMASSVALVFVMHFLKASDFYVVLPPTVANAFSPIFVAWQAVRHHWKTMSVVLKGYTTVLMLEGLHSLDYAFVYVHPELLSWGFTLGFVFAIVFTMFGLSAILEKIGKDKARLELELEYQSGLMQASRLSALSEMAGGVAHEINNPLSIVKMLTYSINRRLDLDRLDKEDLRDKLHQLDGGVSRITKIVSGLIYFSRDASHDPLENANIGEIIETTLSLCSSSLAGKGIELFSEIKNPNSTILCRPPEISQVLLNLINNAKDAVDSKPGAWIKIVSADEFDMAVVRVIDSGPGLSEAVKAKLFQPFFTTKDVGSGTGLGLSSAKGIIETHGGSIRLEEESSHTTFVVRLPLVRPKTV